ncbi:MAG: tRNA (adenosine(37)-N6)-threonylcarbamoyltransferase complex dimerization subunit type 1 TsaB [Rikenellaceae bacterium]|jgi:tRNA threonylcarbamoyladenosine biosynthesis protein TsaB|nr:tRNA (adenosine(37)-N6)-threonylcarbamoyltransferase complex dimerization subunit type 1 TsaB [Rikenellaceae bacterium]
MSLILCIETGTEVCSVALARDGQVVAVRESPEGRDHARLLGPFVEDVLRDAGVEARALDAVAVSSGPGSYTGLRIGVSLAKGLCYGLGISLIGVGSLQALCVVVRETIGEISPTARLCPMIDARRMEVYAQVFEAQGAPLSEVTAEVITPESFAAYNDGAPFYIFGDGAAKCREALPWATFVDVTPSARGQAALSAEAFAAGRFEDVAYFEPFYLKDFVIKTSTKKLF